MSFLESEKRKIKWFLNWIKQYNRIPNKIVRIKLRSKKKRLVAYELV